MNKICNYGHYNQTHGAFTLAEILVALGIIGVIAAMTIPNLIANYQKDQTITQLKKVYTTLNQAYMASSTAHGNYSGWDNALSLTPEAYIEEYWLPHLKILKRCSTYADCGYTKSRPWVKLDGKSVSAEDVQSTTLRAAVILADGTVVSFRIPNPDGTNASINVDLNGPKGPNKQGKDYFAFYRTGNSVRGYDKNFFDTYGGETTMESLRCKNDGGYGMRCAQKIIEDGWQIKDDYPW